MTTSNKISKEQIKKIAELAKLTLSDKENDLYASQMSQILEYISQLNKINTSNVKPLSNVIESNNVTREDSIKKSLYKSISLENVPKTDGDFIIVPKILRSK